MRSDETVHTVPPSGLDRALAQAQLLGENLREFAAAVLDVLEEVEGSAGARPVELQADGAPIAATREPPADVGEDEVVVLTEEDDDAGSDAGEVPAAVPGRADARGAPGEERRQILAIGGDGFSEPLVRYILEQARVPTPRVCFVSTASGDATDYIVSFYEAFHSQRCDPSHLALFGPPAEMENPRRRLLSQDVIFVGGGNTANMLAVWRVHGIDQILRAAWEAGVVLCGVSAGSLCWFEGGVTDSFGATLGPIQDGLGLLSGSNCPHFDGEVQRRPTYRRCIRDGLLGPGYAADDGVALHFLGSELYRVVSARPTATAYRLWRVENGVAMQALRSRTVYIGPPVAG